MSVPRSAVVSLLLLVMSAGAAEAQLRSAPFLSNVGLSLPVAIVQDPTDPGVQFVVEQAGRIRVVRDGILLSEDFLDLRAEVAFGGEQGLFTIAFPPATAIHGSGRFFVNYTRKGDGATVIARFHRSTANPLVADLDPALRKDLVWPDGKAFIAQPFANHNGGHLVFGPDGFLYIGLGDGGAGNDPGRRAQNPQSLLGKMLRIDVDVPDDDPRGYAVPADNPFVDGDPIAALTEIWSFGLRNPWRYNFDDPARGGTGALVIGDVGQGAWEEVDYEPRGAGGRNYGWRMREGTHPNPAVPPTELPAYGSLADLTPPIHEYPHNGLSASITGGYVYRGTALGREFQGRYFFAEFIQGRVWSIGLSINPVTGEATKTDLREHTAELGGPGVLGNISSFGVDADGELFVVSYGAGAVLRILPRPPPDLVVSALTPPTTGVSGRTIQVLNRVRNSGGRTAAGPFRVDIFLSTDSAPGTGVLIGSRTLASLVAGAESAQSTVATVPPTTAPGFYFVSAVVDADNVVTESNDANNGTTAPTQIEIVRPDLAMLAVSGPARGVVTKPIVVTTTVKNVGRATSGTFAIGIYLSTVDTPGSGRRIALRNVASLGINASATMTTSATIPMDLPPATYFLSAMADDARVVIEIGDADDGTNASNNARTAPTQIEVLPFLPDLTITAVSAPPKMGLGRPLTVSFTVRNTGTAPAGAFRVNFFLASASGPPPNPGDGVAVGFKPVAGLAAGGTLATTAVVNVPGNLSDAAYFLSAVADADNTITEITEGAAANGKVTASAITVVRPDLQIVRFEPRGNPATAVAARGGTLALRNVTIKNFAAAPGFAGPTTLKFYVSADPFFDEGVDVEATPAVRIPALAPGASVTVAPTITIPATAPRGPNTFLIARANALGEILEVPGDVITPSIPVFIDDLVDLEIRAVSGPLAVGSGRPMTVSFTVRNAGTAPAGRFRVGVFMAQGSDPGLPGDGVRVGSKDIAGLGTGASLATSVVVNVPADFRHGVHTLSAIADVDDAIPEFPNDGPAANGLVASRTISVVRPDLHVFQFRGPARAARGGTAIVTTTVRSAAPSPAVAPASTLKFYLSDDNVFDAADIELATTRRIPVLGPFATSTGVTTLVIPATVTPGSKFLIARADALDEIFESDEDNNTNAIPIEIGDFVDLQISAVAGPLTATAGRPMTVSVTVRNVGTAPAGPFHVRFFLAPASSPPAAAGDGRDLGFKAIASLATGATLGTTAIVTVPADLAAGSYSLSAVADADGAIPEVGGNDGATDNGRVAVRTINVVQPPVSIMMRQ